MPMRSCLVHGAAADLLRHTRGDRKRQSVATLAIEGRG
ncbi:MAG: hypothetical protein OJF49_000461 [Ktedonobacterales bacterium]|nr:MAG: hypothetical protein OJF49_000461 [Ktedonobacterales bacterium]